MSRTVIGSLCERGPRVFDPIAPARAAAPYVDDAHEAADRLGLREADAGANVTAPDGGVISPRERHRVQEG